MLWFLSGHFIVWGFFSNNFYWTKENFHDYIFIKILRAMLSLALFFIRFLYPLSCINYGYWHKIVEANNARQYFPKEIWITYFTYFVAHTFTYKNCTKILKSWFLSKLVCEINIWRLFPKYVILRLQIISQCFTTTLT